jgi:sporulation protein YlmC with PRC-barrel domain
VAVGDPLTPAAETGYGDAAADAEAEAYDADALTYLEPTSLSAKEFLGEGIAGIDGERIARIDDIVIDANGKAESLVFLAGDVFGLGGKRGALDYNAVDIAVEGDYEPLVRVSLSEDGIKSAAEYVTGETNDYSLASEIIGAQAELLSGDGEGESAVINDIILADSGMVEHLIVQKSAVASIGAGEKYAVDYAKLAIAEGDGGLILNITEEELDASPRFSAMRKAASDAWDKTKDAADDIEDAVDQ